MASRSHGCASALSMLSMQIAYTISRQLTFYLAGDGRGRRCYRTDLDSGSRNENLLVMAK